MRSSCVERRYSPRNRIADCVSHDDGPDIGTILARVQVGIEDLKQEFLGGARDELVELSASVTLAQNSVGTERSKAINRIFRISHDLRGAAGTFDYPLVTRIGSSLCSLIEKMDEIGPLELAVIDLHVGAMKVVMSNRMTGDGDSKARELITGIDAVVRKCFQEPATR